MQFFLVRLSYTAEAWRELLGNPMDPRRRLDPVQRLIESLGGSLPEVAFRTRQGPQHLNGGGGKLVGIGEDDLVTVLAMPDLASAAAFSMAVSAEPGVRDIRLTPLLPLGDAVEVMRRAAAARNETDYSAPGGPSGSWRGAPPAARTGRRGAATRARAGRGGGEEPGGGGAGRRRGGG